MLSLNFIVFSGEVFGGEFSIPQKKIDSKLYKKVNDAIETYELYVKTKYRKPESLKYHKSINNICRNVPKPNSKWDFKNKKHQYFRKIRYLCPRQGWHGVLECESPEDAKPPECDMYSVDSVIRFCKGISEVLEGKKLEKFFGPNTICGDKKAKKIFRHIFETSFGRRSFTYEDIVFYYRVGEKSCKLLLENDLEGLSSFWKSKSKFINTKSQSFRVSLKGRTCGNDDFLRTAIKKGNVEIIKFLLEIGYKMRKNRINMEWILKPENFKEIDKDTLFFLSKNGLNINEYYKKVYVYVDAYERERFPHHWNIHIPPLHKLVRDKRFDVARVLIDIGADINIRDEFGRTILHVLIKRNRRNNRVEELSPSPELKSFVSFLAKKGADFNAKDNDGYSPHYLAGENKEFSDLLLKHGAKIDYVKEDIRAIIESGDMNKIRSFLKIGGPNVRDRYGLTALAYVDLEEVAQLLINHGADVNMRFGRRFGGYNNNDTYDEDKFVPSFFGTLRGMTLLHIASLKGNLGLVKLLVNHGADVKAKAKRTYIFICGSADRERCGRTLCFWPHGCQSDDEYGTVSGLSALAFASASGNLELVRFLAEKIDVKDTDEYGWSPLHFAVASHHLEVVNFLIKKGAIRKTPLPIKTNQAKSPKMSITALHLASYYGNLDIVGLLVQNGAPVNTTGFWLELGETGSPLYFAAIGGHKDIVDFLLKKGAHPDGWPVPAANRTTPLHGAVLDWIHHPRVGSSRPTLESRLEVAKVLLEKGATVNVQDEFGIAPLHIAIHHRYKEVIDLLFKYGADIHLRDKEGRNAIIYTTFGEFICTDGDSPIHILEVIINRGADVNYKWKTGNRIRTPLFGAVRGGHIDVMNLLIKHGAKVDLSLKILEHKVFDHLVRQCRLNKKVASNVLRINSQPKPNQKVENKHTQLCLAVSSQNIKKVHSLLKSGADPNNRDCGEGLTPLHYAKSEKMVKLLVKHGAKVNPVDRVPMRLMSTPLNTASTWGRVHVVKALLEAGAHVDGGHRKPQPPSSRSTSRPTSRQRIVTLFIGDDESSGDEDSSELNTPLINASYSCYTEVAKTLIANGDDIDKKCTFKGKTWSSVRDLLDNIFTNRCRLEGKSLSYIFGG